MSDEDEFEDINSPSDEVADTEEVEDTEETSAEEEAPDVAKLEETNKKLFTRAKNAEGEVKTLKAKLAEKDTSFDKSTNTANVLSRDEAILIAGGMNSDDLDELKTVAEAKNISLLEAQKTPLFQGYLEKVEGERRKEKAKLSSSKGSAATPSVDIKELSKDEHEALVKETMANVR